MDYQTTHAIQIISPIWRRLDPGFVNYKKGCIRLAAASDKVCQLLAHGRWFSSGSPASSTTKTGRHDIAEMLLKVALNTINQIISTKKISRKKNKDTNFDLIIVNKIANRLHLLHAGGGNMKIYSPKSIIFPEGNMILVGE